MVAVVPVLGKVGVVAAAAVLGVIAVAVTGWCS